MKAIGFKTSLPIQETDSFILFDKETPTPVNRDLLVRVQAISVNPVDFKIRQNSLKHKAQETPKIIGWDAVGIVEAVGENVSLFKKGDIVFYAGDITKDGCNQEYQLIDERIVGLAPKNISIEQAAALPLTALTAWEILFDRMRLSAEKDKGKTVLIIGGAGGVGSIAIQLAKKLLGLTVIATASRPETIEWCKKMGADHVVNHRNLVEEVENAGFKQVDIILDFVDITQYWEAFLTLIKPQGHIGSIANAAQPVNLQPLKSKSVSFHWEFMFTRSTFQTDDIQVQHDILNNIASMLDDGTIQSTLHTTLNGFSVEHLKEVHALLESGKAIGKVVIKF